MTCTSTWKKALRGKFLGFMITNRGIEANPDKCTTILEMHSPTNIKEAQNLNGRLASLSRFLPKLVEKAKPFYKLLRKTEPFLWDESCKQAFLASVETYPSAGVQKGQNRWAKVFVSKGENEWSRHQCLLEENVRKTKKRSASFENEGSGVIYARGRY